MGASRDLLWNAVFCCGDSLLCLLQCIVPPQISLPVFVLREWLGPTRLETRTKESNTCASLRSRKPEGGAKAIDGMPLGSTIDRPQG